jgi:hypothetical protein
MKTLFLFVVLSIAVNAQSNKLQLTGNLQADSRFLNDQLENQTNIPEYSSMQIRSGASETGGRSPLLAGIFSLILPGSGEFYSESYLKAGIFLAVEAAVVTTAIVYNKKGDNKTNEFQNYADQNWSVVKYAKWIVDHQDQLQLSHPVDQTHPDGKILYSDIITNENPNLPPWDQVSFSSLNYYENEAGQVGLGFTHQLPFHGDQQYYELIGKYHQYSPGWAMFQGGNDTHIVPDQMLYYSGMRGKANDYYNTAETAVIGIYINHFLSALDGVWSAVRFNKDIAFNARVQQYDLTDRSILIPTLNIKYNF